MLRQNSCRWRCEFVRGKMSTSFGITIVRSHSFSRMKINIWVFLENLLTIHFFVSAFQNSPSYFTAAFESSRFLAKKPLEESLQLGCLIAGSGEMRHNHPKYLEARMVWGGGYILPFLILLKRKFSAHSSGSLFSRVFVLFSNFTSAYFSFVFLRGSTSNFYPLQSFYVARTQYAGWLAFGVLTPDTPSPPFILLSTSAKLQS